MQGFPSAQGPAQPAPDEYDAGPMTEPGPQMVKELAFNQQVQNLILSRIQAAMQSNPAWGDALEDALTPEAAMELAEIIPEIAPVLRSVGLLGDPGMEMGGPAPAAQPSPAQPMPPTPNPITGVGAPVSRGLMG